MSDIGYSEKDFENYIVNLLTSKSGYIHGSNNDYNSQKYKHRKILKKLCNNVTANIM